MKYLHLLQNKLLRRLFLVTICDDIAIMLDLTALFALIVYYWNGQLASVMMLSLVYSAPNVLLATLAGALADRYPIKSILYVSNIGCIILTLFLIFVDNLFPLMMIVLCRASLKVFFEPACYVYMRYAIGENEIVHANAFFNLLKQLRMFFIPGLGAILLLFMSPRVIFIITAVFFAISGLLVTLLDNYQTQTKNKIFQPLKLNILAAIGVLNNNTVLFVAFYSIIMATFAVALIDGLFAIFAKYTGLGVDHFSFILSAVGLGGIFSLFLFLSEQSNKKFYFILASSTIGMGMTLVLLALIGYITFINTFIVQLILWAFFGFMAATVSTSFSILLQANLPIEVLGRVRGYNNALSGLCLVTAPIIGYFISSYTSIYMTFALSGFALMITGVFLYCSVI